MADRICGPLPLVTALGVFQSFPRDANQQQPSKVTEYFIPQESKAWLSHSTIWYTFLKGEPKNWQLDFVENAIAEYTRYANVNLTRTKDAEKSADIRISFNKDDGSWSAIGTDALKIADDEATMNLGFLPDDPVSDAIKREELYNLILHQFGHAFGLTHEWNTEWGTLLTGAGNAIEQHKKAFEKHNTSNFEDPDRDSIMKFSPPKEFITVSESAEMLPPFNGLSNKDKAWLTLMYPGKASEADEDTGVLHSLDVLGLPLKESSQILLGSTVSEMRFYYHKYISNKWQDRLSIQAIKDAQADLKSVKVEELPSESHSLQGKVTGITPLVDHNSEDDLYDAVTAAVLDPQFRQVLADVVNKDNGNQPGVQNFVPFGSPSWPNPGFMPRTSWLGGNVFSGINPQAPSDVQNFLGPLLGVLGRLIFSDLPLDAASGIYSQALPPDVEQGIFTSIVNFMKRPVVINTIKNVATDMYQQYKSNQQ